MVSLSAVRRLRSPWLGVLCLGAALSHPAHAVIQLASGTPVEDADTAVVQVPLYFYTDEAIMAGQFDVSLPSGWEVLAIGGEDSLGALHSIEANELPDGGVRVVIFSLDNSEIPNGSLGALLLEPPSVGEIADLTFDNPLFVTDEGNILSVTPGFPALQVLATPLDQTVLAGQKATLSVSALAIDPTFQWFQGSSGDESLPVGANASLFETPALVSTTQYWVKITDTFGESVNSAAATINVDTGPTYIFDPNSRSIGWRAGSGQANLQTPVGNAWTASASADWLVVETANGTGPGAIAYTFGRNNSLSARSAQITVEGVTFTVNQAARPSVFADYPFLEGTTWRSVPWFGLVTDNHYPWAYHQHHGWLYIIPAEDLNAFYAYSVEGELGWLYLSSAFYNQSTRWMYSFEYESFLFFSPLESVNPTSRLFYEANAKRWFFFPED